MEKSVVVTTDSVSDLPRELAEKYNIKVLPLMVLLGDESFLDGETFTCADMKKCYKEKGIIPKTSAPSLQMLFDFFKPLVDEGCEVVHISVGSALSSTYNNVHIVAEELGGIYPVDTNSLSNGITLLAMEAAECRDMGMSAGEIAEHTQRLSEKINVSFVLDTLDFIWKGGRCSGIAAMGANLLKLKPALEMRDGKLVVYKKYRGNIKNVYGQYIRERLKDKKLYKNRMFLITTEALDDETESEILGLITPSEENISILRAYTGCSIFSHCGPGALGVMFIGE